LGGEALAAGSTRRLLPGGDAVEASRWRVEEAGGAPSSLAAPSSLGVVVIVASFFLSPPSPRALTVAVVGLEDLAAASCGFVWGRKPEDLDEIRDGR
jgi:hypothetical protein